MSATSRWRAAALVLLLLAMFLAVVPAYAATTEMSCTLAVSANISPGLGLVGSPQTITGTLSLGTEVSSLTPCMSLTGVPFVGGTGQISAESGNLACLLFPTGGMLGSTIGTADVTWYDNGHHVAGHSVITFTASVTGLVPVASASVTSGDLQGTSLVVTPVPTGFSGNCGVLGSPIVSVSFAGPAAFVAL